MAYATEDPRYGFTFTVTNTSGTSRTKTVNNINIAMGGSSAGYTPEEVGDFIKLLGDSLTGGTVDQERIYINAQYPLRNYGE